MGVVNDKSKSIWHRRPDALAGASLVEASGSAARLQMAKNRRPKQTAKSHTAKLDGRLSIASRSTIAKFGKSGIVVTA